MRIINKKARYEYEITDSLEAGLQLTGAEAKALREGRCDLSRAVVRIVGGEAFLINANISISQIGKNPTRMRKLLLHKDQLVSLQSKSEGQKLTLVPLALYNKGRLVKLELGMGRSKRKHEKREAIKMRDIERQMQQELKDR